MRFSVISACYNGSKYIESAVKSLDSQSFKDFELIVVDDGSTDESGIILDRLQESRTYMRVIHTENKGAASAVKTAITYATGDYYLFMDADDQYVRNAFEIIAQYLDEFHSDIVIYGFRKLVSEKELFKTKSFHPYMLTNKREQLLTVLSSSEYNPLWRKAIRASLIDGNENEGKRFRVANDLYVSIEAYENASSILFVPDHLYEYYMIDGSIIHSVSYKNYTVDYPVGTKVLEMIERANVFTSDDYSKYKAFCVRNVVNQANGICLFSTEYKNKVDLFNRIKASDYYRRITNGSINSSSLDFYSKLSSSLFMNDHYHSYVFINRVYYFLKRIKHYLGGIR